MQVETTSSPPAGGEAASDGSLPVRIGTYRVLRRLATGGTSDVLLAKSEGPQAHGQTVVLKLLLQEYRDDPQFEKMFASEAAAYSRLSHSAIVRLHDFFTDGDQLVMVLEYVDGMALHRLRALLKRGKFLDDSAAMFVGWRVFGALAAAHAAKDPKTGALSPVIHRDVNPSNVLIPWDGQVKIADFGIAKVAGVDNDKTAAGFIKGTYGYMAPEQVKGENVTDRADVYAASLLLWELLVGRKAIVRGGTSDMDVLRAMAEPAFPALSALRPELPLEVLDAVDRGLERDPAKRTITADELAGVLRISCNLEDGRQRLVDALGGVRPVQRPDELAVTVSRTPRPPESSADATIPNLPAFVDDSQSLQSLPPPPTLSSSPPPPVAAPKSAKPPAPRATVKMSSSTLRSSPTLMGMSPSTPPAPPAATITEKSPKPPPTVALTPTPRPGPPVTRPPSVPPPPPPPPPPVTVRTPPPPPPVVAAPPVHVPPVHVPTMAAGFVISPFAVTAPIAATPAPFAPTSAKQPSNRPPPPPPPPAPPPPVAQLPVVWAPPPPPAVEPRPQLPTFPTSQQPSRSGRMIAAVGALVALLVIIVVIAVERGRSPSAYVPPGSASIKASSSPAASAPAAATAPAPPTVSAPPPSPPPVAVATPSATASTSTPAPSGTMGTITVGPSQSGHRIWVDKHIVGESPGTFSIRCGLRSVQVGSQGWRHNVNVPCGGDVVIH